MHKVMHNLSLAMLCAALAGAVPVAARAAAVSGTYDFTATNFTTVPAAPITTPVQGAITITFDNSQSYANSESGISFTSASLPLASTVAFTYVPGADFLEVGGIADGVLTSDPYSVDFSIIINGATSANPTVSSFTVSSGNGLPAISATSAVVSFAAAVPEPASVALLGGGVLGLLWLGRRQRPTDAAQPA